MRLAKADTVLGLPIRLIRNLVRRINGRVWADADLATHFDIALETATRFAGVLVARGFFEPARPPDWPAGHPRGFIVAARGRQLMHATFVKPIPLAYADVLIQELVTRIDAINARDELVFRVPEVLVFGSCFRREADVADIDLGVRLDPRRLATNWPKERFDRARASGQLSLTFLRMLAFGDNEVFKLMKGPTPYFEVHPWNGFKRWNTPSCRIYPRPTPEDGGVATEARRSGMRSKLHPPVVAAARLGLHSPENLEHNDKRTTGA
jgi:predicted nucleotidyltransferase